jgi:DNA-binding GntR family transcriptional regulator
METRRLVELHALPAAARQGATLGPRLTALIAAQARCAAAEDAAGFVGADREFHREIVRATGNAILVSLHDSMRDRQSRMGLAAIAQDAGRMREILTEHEAIVEAIRAGRAEAAAERLGPHLDRTLELLRRRPAGPHAP